MKPFALASSDLVLDAPSLRDVDEIVRYCRDPLFESVMSTPWPYQLEHAHGFVDTVVPRGWETGRELTWAVRSAPGTPLIGMISLRNETTTRSSLGFWIGDGHRGRGYASGAVHLVCDWAFDAGREIVAWECFAGNLASAGVARRAGFRFSGIAPSNLPARDGSHPSAWHGELRRHGDGAAHDTWPAETTRAGLGVTSA